MLRHTNLIFFIFIFTTVTMATQCSKEDVPAARQQFSDKVNISPYKKHYNVNDTLWINYTTSSKTFFDSVSNRRLPTNTIKFRFGAVLLPKYGTPSNPSDGFCSFILPSNITLNYYTSQSGTSVFFEVGCDNSIQYNIKIGVILKYQGIYVLNLLDAITLEPCINETNPYPRARVQFFYNLAYCNSDVYLSIPSTSRQEFPVGFTEGQIRNKVAFALQVQ